MKRKGRCASMLGKGREMCNMLAEVEERVLSGGM